MDPTVGILPRADLIPVGGPVQPTSAARSRWHAGVCARLPGTNPAMLELLQALATANLADA
ncbi:hypothetical protein A5640_22760 [Mycobacterium asiaticum]|uniref:Uncharacterized protein n=1 Tax=Mycobacterium asiaticum TaxID=1790 RepID=A0A1A3KAR1_MYCAS|nr:hypothetical protein A5640_22760 [Mycobacterium asiaticum]